MDQIFSQIQSLAAGNEETIKLIMALAQNERRKIVLSCSPELSFQAAEDPGRWSALSLKRKRTPKLLALLDVKKTELTAKEIIAGWLPKVKLKEPEAELPANVNYTCKSFGDVMTLNSTMLQMCQALRMLPRREDEVVQDLKTILENFELLQACLKELEDLLLERDLNKMAKEEEVRNALQREVSAINAQIKRLAMATEAHNRKETQRLHNTLGNSWSKKVPIFKESNAIFIEGTKGKEHEQFQFPSCVRLGRPDGNHLYVADSANGRVLVMEATSGAFVAAFRLHADDCRLSFPIGLALDPSTDRLYVCDSHNHCVHVLDATRGTPILRLGSHGSSGDASNLVAPHGVAVDSSRRAGGLVYVTDLGNNRIQVFDASNGAFVRSIHDSLDGWQGRKLSHPYGIALSSEDDDDGDDDDSKKLYVVNNGGHCVYVLEASSGAFIRQFGSLGVGDGQFMSPTDVALDGHGRVYVADFGNNRVQAFSAEGAHPHLASFGSSLTVSPNGIALDADGNVYVVGFTNQILSYWQQQQQQ